MFTSWSATGRGAAQARPVPGVQPVTMRDRDCSHLPFNSLHLSLLNKSIHHAESISVPSSPLQAHVGTNYTPAAFERLHIRKILENSQQEIDRLNKALACLHATLERLKHKRDAFQIFFDEHTALLSPIRRAPLEILSEIFNEFLPAYFSEDSAAARRDRMLPSHICQGWRNLSLSTPQFWADIDVDVDTFAINRKLECVQTWLARSKQCPLTVKIKCVSAKYAAQWCSLLAVVLLYSSRWLDATIISTVVTDLSPIKHNLPLLETLMVDFLEWPRDAPFEFAPRLRRLMAPGCEALVNDALPWAQLLQSEVIYGSVPGCLAVMRKLVNATRLTIRPNFLDAIIDTFASYPPLRMKYLSLLLMAPKRSIRGIHECLDLPSLKTYGYSEGNTEWRVSSFVSLAVRSSWVLQCLEITLVDVIGKEDLTLLLQHLPDLSILSINCTSHCGTQSNNVQELITDSRAYCLVPRLTTVTFDYDEDFDFQLLFTMIESRYKLENNISAVRKAAINVVEKCPSSPPGRQPNKATCVGFRHLDFKWRM
ncbi:hypothetical protein HWV62_5865 [Athelia sp. TMB]|nr:hypothetical protein HWV62_5865 [Athelia sp. TMB]